jgi:hypothetical protein
MAHRNAARALAGALLATGLACAAEAADIETPPSVDPGEAALIRVEGAGPGWRLELWGPVTQTGEGGRLREIPMGGELTIVDAPAAPGSYRLVLLDPGGVRRARADLQVAGVPVSLDAPRAAEAGGTAGIGWKGPAQPGDRIQIVDSAGAVVADEAAEGTAGAMNRIDLATPSAPGPYTVRYLSGRTGAVLVSAPLTVTAPRG